MTALTHAARRLARPALIVLGIGTFLAVLGPFGSHGLGFPLVWFYWTGFIALGAVIGYGAGNGLPKAVPNAPRWVSYAAAAAVVSVPVTAAVAGVNTLLEGAQAYTFDEIAVTYLAVFVISSFATAVIYAVDRLSDPQAETAPPTPGAALAEKLPVKLRRAPILSLTAEDHYLRVRTGAGEALILMRLTDAIAACETLDGARTHRSWWVARQAVSDAQKGDGRGTLILQDGTEAPVSRTYYPALREAGWF